MKPNAILITEQIRNAVNEFLGAELIPTCAIGSELAYHNGNLVIKTFNNGNMHGYRTLNVGGEITNIITEIC